jgi:RNA polymerase sigma-70 factor (ECF subfamily)
MSPVDLDVHFSRIVAGDATAFGHWLAGAEPALRASLHSFAASVDTEAVLQESLLRVWQVAPRHVPDGRENSLLRLAVRIARNLAIDEARRARLEPTDDAALDAMLAKATSHVAVGDPLLRSALDACRERLGGKPAEAFEARLEAAGGEPDETLAARLGMRVNTFLQNFTRARRQLVDCLERRHVDLAMELGR